MEREIYKLMDDTFSDFKYLARDMQNQPQSVVLEVPIELSQNSFLPCRNTLRFETGRGFMNFDLKKEENSYCIEIVDLVSEIERKWHGTILLDALFVLMQEMEKESGIDIPIIFGELSSVDNKSYNIKFYNDYLTVKSTQIKSDYIIVYNAYKRIGLDQYIPNIIEVGYSKEIQALYLVKSFKYIRQ